MYCRVCKLEIFSSRSDTCIGCSAVLTLQQEFVGEWGSSVARNIGADIAVGAARNIRALRILSNRELEAPRTAEAARPVSPLRSPEVPGGSTKEEAAKTSPRPRVTLREKRLEDRQDSLSSSYETYEEESSGEKEAAPKEPEKPVEEEKPESGSFPKSRPATRFDPRGRASEEEVRNVRRIVKQQKEFQKETQAVPISPRRDRRKEKKNKAPERERVPLPRAKDRSRSRRRQRHAEREGLPSPSQILPDRFLRLTAEEAERFKADKKEKWRKRRQR